MKQVFDVDAVDVFSRRDFSQSERQFARGVGKNTRKTAAGEIENARVKRDRRACRHREDHSTEKSLSVLWILCVSVVSFSFVMRWKSSSLGRFGVRTSGRAPLSIKPSLTVGLLTQILRKAVRMSDTILVSSPPPHSPSRSTAQKRASIPQRSDQVLCLRSDSAPSCIRVAHLLRFRSKATTADDR